MNRSWPIGLIVLAALTGSAYAVGSNHDASSKGIYADNEPDASLKRRIESLMGVYMVHGTRRHKWERVTKRRNTVKVTIWHPVGETSTQELITRAVQWLVFGRTEYAKGARGVFSEFAKIDAISLEFTDIIRKENTRRRRKRPDRLKTYLSIHLTRQAFERLDIAKLKDCGERIDCRLELKKQFKRYRIDSRYIKRRRRASK